MIFEVRERTENDKRDAPVSGEAGRAGGGDGGTVCAKLRVWRTRRRSIFLR
jgi:hypothetical protein